MTDDNTTTTELRYTTDGNNILDRKRPGIICGFINAGAAGYTAEKFNEFEADPEGSVWDPASYLWWNLETDVLVPSSTISNELDEED